MQAAKQGKRWKQRQQSQIHFAPWTLVLHGYIAYQLKLFITVEDKITFAQAKHQHFQLPQSLKMILILVGQRPPAGQNSGAKLEPRAHHYSQLAPAYLQASSLIAEVV
jgi:hypothetical protein